MWVLSSSWTCLFRPALMTAAWSVNLAASPPVPFFGGSLKVVHNVVHILTGLPVTPVTGSHIIRFQRFVTRLLSRVLRMRARSSAGRFVARVLQDPFTSSMGQLNQVDANDNRQRKRFHECLRRRLV